MPATIGAQKENVMEPVAFIQKGQMTIPKKLREAYHIEPGSKGVVVPMNGGFIVLVDEPKTPALFDQIRDDLAIGDMSLEEMLMRMRRIRDTSDYENKTLPGQ